MDKWKAEMGRVREEKRREEERSEKRKRQKKEDADARKGSKVAKHCVFPMICGSGGSKSRLAKAAGAEPSGQMRDEKLHSVVARSTFPSQDAQTHHAQTTFGSWDVEKVRDVVARSAFPSQHVQSTPCSDMFGPLLEVEMSKKCTPLWREARFHFPKCTKDSMLGPLLEVEMSKKRTLLWREAPFQVESVKNRRVRSSFGRSDVIARDMRKGFLCCQKWVKREGFVAFQLQPPLHYPPLQLQLQLHDITVHYTTLHYLYYTTLHAPRSTL